MAGFGHYPFGHQPFGGGVSDLTPGALSVVLSTLAGTVSSGGSSVPVVLTLSTVAPAVGTTTQTFAPISLTVFFLPAAVTSYSTTLAPPGLAGVLSLGAPSVFAYTDTVTVSPSMVGLVLGTLAPTSISAFDTTLEVSVLPLALSTLPVAQPVTATQMFVMPLTQVLSILGPTQPLLANTVSPASLTLTLTTVGTDIGEPLLLTPMPVMLDTSILQDPGGGGYFVFSGLSFLVTGIQVFSPWTVDVGGVTGTWQVVVRVHAPWALATRSS